MRKQRYVLAEMLLMISGANHRACLQMYVDNIQLFNVVPGSSHNHQAWPGGYHDHVEESMNFIIDLYKMFTRTRTLPFSLSDALTVMFLHDIEKPWKYELDAGGRLVPIEALKSKSAQHEFRARKLREYGVVLSPDQENAMKYVEGEYADYSRTELKMGQLAALCHMADVASARLFFDYPRSGEGRRE